MKYCSLKSASVHLHLFLKLTLKSIYFMNAFSVLLPLSLFFLLYVAFMYWGLIIKHKIVGIIKMFRRQTQKSQHKKKRRSKKNCCFYRGAKFICKQVVEKSINWKMLWVDIFLYMFGASREVCSLFINFAVWKKGNNEDVFHLYWIFI